MIEKEGKQENTILNLNRKRNKLMMYFARVQTENFLYKSLNLSVEEVKEFEILKKDVTISNATKALFLLFEKELSNPIGKVENINMLFDKFYNLMHLYQNTRVLGSFISTLLKDSNKENSLSLVKPFLVMYQEYINKIDHISKKAFKKYREKELKKTYVSINDFDTFYDEKNELLIVEDVKKLDIVTWRKAPFYDKSKWFFDVDRFSTIKDILSEKIKKDQIFMQKFLKTIYDKRYNKIENYTFEKYQEDNMLQRKSLLGKSLKDISANDVYFVVGLFESYMNDKYKDSKNFQSQVMNPVTQLVLDGLKFEAKDYKKIKIAKERIPNIFAQYFQEDIANISYGLEIGRESFNFEQVTGSLIAVINDPKKKSLKSFTLNIGGSSTHRLLTEAVTKEKISIIIEKYNLGSDVFKAKDYKINEFLLGLLINCNRLGVIALFKDAGINITIDNVQKVLSQYIKILGKADLSVLNSIDRAEAESKKGIVDAILGYGKVGIANFGTDMTGKGVKWQIDNMGKIKNIFDNGYTKEQLDLLKREFISKNKNKIDNLKKMAKDNGVLELWTDAKGTIVTGVHPAPVKSYERAIQKLIEDYKCDFSKSTDMSRATLEYPNLQDLIKGMQSVIKGCKDDPNVDQVAIVDKIGPVFELAEEPTGYRDIKLLIKLKDGNTMELMFHTKQTLEIKQKGLSGRIIKERMIGEGISIDDQEMSYLLERINDYKNNKEKLFTNTEDNPRLKRKEESILLRDKNQIFADDTYLSGDMFFYAHRDLKKDNPLKQKLQKAETIVWEYAREQEMKQFMPNQKNGKKIT